MKINLKIFMILLSVLSLICPSVLANSVAESYHPYANGCEETWNIDQPGASEIRLHFSKLEFAKGDTLALYNSEGYLLKLFDVQAGDSIYYEDFWTDWFATDTIELSLKTNYKDTAYGFTIDNIETRDASKPFSSFFAESYHPYANRYKESWIIDQPGASEIRLHFSKLELADGDTLALFDEEGHLFELYKVQTVDTILYEDIWTEWFATDTIELILETNYKDTAFGFTVDKIETRGSISIIKTQISSSIPTSSNTRPTTQTAKEKYLDVPIFDMTDYPNIKLGFGNDSFSDAGCAVTCAAMVMKYYGVDTNPEDLNEKLKGLGEGSGFLYDSNESEYDLIKWEAVPLALDQDISYERKDYEGIPADINYIKELINQEYPVIAKVVYKYSGKESFHFVVICGYDEQGNFLINDPLNGKKNINLVPRYTYYGNDAEGAIFGIRVYRGDIPDSQDNNAPANNENFIDMILKMLFSFLGGSQD